MGAPHFCEIAATLRPIPHSPHPILPASFEQNIRFTRAMQDTQNLNTGIGNPVNDEIAPEGDAPIAFAEIRSFATPERRF